MLVLGIETSTPVSSVAIGSGQGLVASALLARGRGHCEFLVPAIQSLMDQSGLQMRSLAGIAVGIGPGLFTGLRVGVATAKGMAQALGTPLIGVSSLDLLALSVRHSNRLICACSDARRGEIFCAFYRHAPGGVQRLSDYAVWPPDRLAGEVQARGEVVLFVGNGALAYRDVLPPVHVEFASPQAAFPRADALVELALPRLEREDYDSLYAVEPMYLRRSDAEISWEDRGVVIERPNRVRFRGSENGASP